MPAPTSRQLRQLHLASAAAFILVLLALAATCVARAHRKPEDFGAFYYAAQAMLNGKDIYTSGVGAYIYPAPIAFIFQPLAFLPVGPAAEIWLFINIALIFLSILIVAREIVRRWNLSTHPLGPALPWIIAFFASLLATDKIRAVLSLGQSDCFMLLGFALALRYIDKKPLRAALAVGITAAVKYIPFIFLPYFLIRKNFAAALLSILVFVLFLFLPAIELGFPKTLHYNAVAFSGVAKLVGISPTSQPATTQTTPTTATADLSDSDAAPTPVHGWKISWERSVSFTSALARGIETLNLPSKLVPLPVALLFLIIVAAIILIARKNGVRLLQSDPTKTPQQSAAIHSLEWAILIFLALAFSPQTTARHMVLFVLIYTFALALLFLPQSNRSRVSLIIALLFMTAAQTLPPAGIGMDGAVHFWRNIAGVSWCAAILMIILTNHATQILSSTRPNSSPNLPQ